MSEQNTPLWLQDREAVIASHPPEVWRYNVPNYAFTNKRLNAERLKHFEPGSLEDTITNLVRVFEMEATNKPNPKDWISVDPDVFTMTTNGGPAYTVQDIVTKGGYNLFMGERPTYKASENDFDSSEKAFHDAFRSGFLWELLTLTPHLPTATLTWRHWGLQNGTFNGHKGDGTLLEVFGSTIATLNDQLKLTKLEHYFDGGAMLDSLSGRCPFTHT